MALGLRERLVCGGQRAVARLVPVEGGLGLVEPGDTNCLGHTADCDERVDLVVGTGEQLGKLVGGEGDARLREGAGDGGAVGGVAGFKSVARSA